MEQSRKIKLSCKGLGKTFKTPKGDFEVLRDLTFDVYENEFLVIFGPGQCGKTTLLNMLAGLEPSDGTVFHNGKTVEMPEPSRAMVYQTMALFPWMTVMDNVAFSQKVKKIPKKERAQIAQKFIDLVGLTGFEKSFPIQLSGGMKRRVGIAQALLNDPEILILDEPTAGLDPGERVRFRNLLSEFAQERIVLISTHIVSDVEYIAAENAVMKAGKIIAQDTTEGLVKQIEAKVWQGNIPMEQLARWEHRLRVVNLRNEPDGTVTLRYLADAPQLPDSVLAQPRLEDLYLWLFPEEMEEAK